MVNDVSSGSPSGPSSNPDVVIWQADGRATEDVSYADLLEELLNRTGLTSHRVDIVKRGLTDTELAAPVHMLTGGSTSVHSPVAWMQRTLAQAEDVVGSAREGRALAIGVCLGAQILASALLGRPATRVASDGMEVGFVRIEEVAQQPLSPSAADPYMDRGVGSDLMMAVFHYEQIVPELLALDGVSHLYANAHTEVQGFRAFDNVFGYQFHPEISTMVMGQLIDHYRAIIRAWGGDIVQAQASILEMGGQWVEQSFDLLGSSKIRRFLSGRTSRPAEPAA